VLAELSPNQIYADLTAVAEPSAALLFASALGLLAWRRKKRPLTPGRRS